MTNIDVDTVIIGFLILMDIAVRLSMWKTTNKLLETQRQYIGTLEAFIRGLEVELEQAERKNEVTHESGVVYSTVEYPDNLFHISGNEDNEELFFSCNPECSVEVTMRPSGEGDD